MGWTRKLPASLFLAAVLLASAGTAHATDGYFLNGIGAKAKGAGGVAIALPQDALSINVNPAAAMELGHRLDAGFEFFRPSRDTTISGNGAGLNGTYSGNGKKNFLLPEVAYVRPLSDKFAIGLSINGHGGMNTTYKANPFAAFGATGTAGVDLKQIFISPTLAARIAPGHSVGVSPVIVFQLFKGRGFQPFAFASSDPGNFTNRGTDRSAGFGFRLGYLGKIHERVRVGAFYQSKMWTGKFKKYGGLFAEGGGFDVPPTWGGGIAVDATDRLTLAGDIKRIEYSKVESVGNPLSPLFAGVPFGADNGPGFGWRDITVYKAAAIYRASERWTLRVGYGRSGNPIPRSETFLNILAPGVVQDHFTAGATYKLSPNFEITGYVMRAPTNKVAGQGSIPMPFGGGEADIRLAETAAGLSAGIIF